MEALKVIGGRPLNGVIRISGAKNASLPLMAASLLTSEPLELDNVPDLKDINTMTSLLAAHGVKINWLPASDNSAPSSLKLTADKVHNFEANYELVRKMRASILVLGPMLARYGKARVSLPGGCSIGARPVDLHIQGLRALGANIDLDHGYIEASFANGRSLQGGHYIFPTVTVTGTENLLMAAVLARGQTVLENAAIEPEVTNLANCLLAMGAKIEGIGTHKLLIEGVEALSGAHQAVIPDRIEAGSYIIAAAMTRGNLTLQGQNLSSLLPNFLDTMKKAGLSITEQEDQLTAKAEGDLIGVDITTSPFPDYPTDLQAQATAMMTVAAGHSTITENIFENRFMHVPELLRMGADIKIEGNQLHIKGVSQLTGASVMASDLRASMALVLAALAAEGETVINRIYHLDRGYSNIDQKLGACGAIVTRLNAS